MDFLASDYCQDIEMMRALERSEKGEARVVPVILKPCDWKTSPLARFQALPKDGLPVVDWATNDHGFVNAVKGLRRLIVELCGLGAGPSADHPDCDPSSSLAMGGLFAACRCVSCLRVAMVE